jgi:hypothetical protein
MGPPTWKEKCPVYGTLAQQKSEKEFCWSETVTRFKRDLQVAMHFSKSELRIKFRKP